MVILAVSSSVMTKSAVLSEIVALVGLDKVTVPVSSNSSFASAVVTTSKVAVVSPAEIVSVSVTAVKSLPLVAVPELLSYSTVMSSEDGLVNEAVKVAVPPSVVVPSEILIAGGASSSVITKSEVASPIVALFGLLKVKVAVSSDSSVVSVVIGTTIVPVVTPADRVSVPVVPV